LQFNFYGKFHWERTQKHTYNAQNILIDEVYTNLEKSNAKKAIGIKANKDTQKYLTPVTIVVVDTISSVKSRILLKFLLDSG
jgi:hypothetical protein